MRLYQVEMVFETLKPIKRSSSMYMYFTHTKNYTDKEFEDICKHILDSGIEDRRHIFDILISEYGFEKFILDDHTCKFEFHENK